jgi:hypothetical protein
MSFKPIKKSDKTKELFYKIPKQLMLEAKYKKMKDSAKILYSILYERTDLSVQNDWFDSNEDAYIICTYDEIQTYFGASRSKVTSALKDLEDFDLIRKSKIVTKEGQSVNVIYVGHVETTEDTLQVLMDKHKEDYHQLREKKRKYKREYDRKQSALKKAKRESKLSESENQTTIENTTIPRVKSLKVSNINRSPKIRLRVVRKSDYRNTNNRKTDNISMYVCNGDTHKQSLLNLYEKHLVPSTYVKAVLNSVEEKQQISYELLEVVILKALNNKRIKDAEKWIIKTINQLIEKGIKTVEEYEASIKEFNKKYTKQLKSGTKGTYQVKTRFHNINDATKKYTPEELEKLLKENQKAKYAKREMEELNGQVDEVITLEITEDIVNKCMMDEGYFNSLTEDVKDTIRSYMIENNKFMPLHISGR